VEIIERIKMVMQKCGGKLPRCELVDALINNFSYYDDFAKFKEDIPEVLEVLENIKTERAKKVARAIEECKMFVPMDRVEELFLELLMTEIRKCL
jgi:hypothetical protein